MTFALVTTRAPHHERLTRARERLRWEIGVPSLVPSPRSRSRRKSLRAASTENRACRLTQIGQRDSYADTSAPCHHAPRSISSRCRFVTAAPRFANRSLNSRKDRVVERDAHKRIRPSEEFVGCAGLAREQLGAENVALVITLFSHSSLNASAALE